MGILRAFEAAGADEAAQFEAGVEFAARQVQELVAAGDSPETRRRVEAERACVAALGAGCLAPVAAHHDGRQLTALIAAEDGSWVERRAGADPTAIAAALLEASRDNAA